MNTAITFPPPAPALKLARPSAEKWAATLVEERRRLQEDHDMLREREANLRDYEARLRGLQAEIEASRNGVAVAAPAAVVASVTPFQRPASGVPFVDDPALHAAWEKLHRARELLEAEQAHLAEDRQMIHDQLESMKRKEDALIVRETRLAEREALVTAAMPPAPLEGGTSKSKSPMAMLTNAPFAMARTVFGRKKKA